MAIVELVLNVISCLVAVAALRAQLKPAGRSGPESQSRDWGIDVGESGGGPDEHRA
jgi:hypothetical protein